MWSQKRNHVKQVEQLVKKLQTAKARVDANLHHSEANPLLEQLLHIQHRLEDLESHHLEAKKKEVEWKKCKES